VRRGKKHPGANYVRRADGKKVKVTEINHEALADEIDIGWAVERHIRDGDIVLFNRQPSLHRVSIMAHRVRVMPGKTFRLNPTVCPPYNADYDGDEMNLHVLQTEEARAEAKILMAVEHNIISPRFGRPIIGGIHDYITGLFLLTWGEKKFKREEVLEVLKNIDIDDLGEPAEYWTGKQIFSMILPSGLNLHFRAKMCEKCIERGLVCLKEKCPREAYVKIRGGELISGVIDEVAIGSFKGRIIDSIFRQYGEKAAKRFISDVSRIAINYILQAGFSFGISDEDIPKEGKEQIAEAMREAEHKIEALIKAYEAEELEALPGRTLEETLELLVMQELGRARDDAGDIAERYLGIENAAVLMAKSGARGSMLNLTQMAACVGQQSVRGERIKRGYQGRTLPHFKHGDRGANARGFVRASFKDGLSPTEYFFHAVGGREALVDTAVRTSQSGYFQRRLINALQDLEVKNDGTVRETRDTIVQFKYGEDGVDPSKGEYGKIVDIDEIIGEAIGAEAGA
jgi:DNA-directed RNA polymerase subunit A'